jgi:TolB protein
MADFGLANGRSSLDVYTFISNFEGEDLFYQIRLDGTNLQRLVSPLGRNTAAVLSPDERWLAYVTVDQELMLVSRDGLQEHCITCNQLGPASLPAWAPNSHELVVPVQQGAQQNLYRVNIDGTNVVRLTNALGTLNTDPAWSPNSQRIVFRSDRNGGQFNIYVMNADGSDLHQLTTEGGSAPAWSPDGQRIAFVSSYPGKADGIYIMNADGSNLTRLTSSASDNEPTWIQLPHNQ